MGMTIKNAIDRLINELVFYGNVEVDSFTFEVEDKFYRYKNVDKKETIEVGTRNQDIKTLE